MPHQEHFNFCVPRLLQETVQTQEISADAFRPEKISKIIYVIVCPRIPWNWGSVLRSPMDIVVVMSHRVCWELNLSPQQE